MLAASCFAARFILRQGGSFSRWECLRIGAMALVFMLLAEVGFVLIRGLVLREYIASRDPVPGTAYPSVARRLCGDAALGKLEAARVKKVCPLPTPARWGGP